MVSPRSVKVAEPFETNREGTMPKAYANGGRMNWAVRFKVGRLSSALMESYLLLWRDKGQSLSSYIIVQLQLVFNRFFVFYMEIFQNFTVF